jgi:endonuclease/exonuclease/phosphatase family metal-dependent hydrolase
MRAMSIRWLVPSLVALAVGLGCPEDAKTTGGGGSGGTGGAELPDPLPLTIATWNVKNFYNDVLDDDADFEEVDPNYAQHRAAIGLVLASLEADIVMFQEVEHDGVLIDLDAVELDGAYPHVAHVDGNDPRGVDVALLSKLPIDAVVSHRHETFPKQGTNAPLYKFARDVLEVHFTFNGRPLVLLGVHFKAKNDDDPDKRLAEAQRTRAIADQLRADDPERAVLVLGDFNDLPGSEPYLAVVGPASDAFANAADLVSTADRFTFVFNGNEELVDHQMMAPRLTTLLESATILHAAEVDAASDHAPLVATYQIH